MTLQDALHQQILAFHGAILDNCERAAKAGTTDHMALRLRGNALALAKLQMAMMPKISAHPPQPEIEAAAAEPTPDAAEVTHVDPPLAPVTDRVLTGDILAMFTSRRLEPDESPHEVWQTLHESQPAKLRHNPASRHPGFRSPSG